jgi:hypothetical protein
MNTKVDYQNDFKLSDVDNLFLFLERILASYVNYVRAKAQNTRNFFTNHFIVHSAAILFYIVLRFFIFYIFSDLIRKISHRFQKKIYICPGLQILPDGKNGGKNYSEIFINYS